MRLNPIQLGARGKTGLWFLGAWLVTTLPVGAQTNFQALTVTGPPSNRVNIVFLAEGYRTNQYAQFFSDATNAANLLLTNPPYAQYRSFFNVYALAVPSAQSGSDHPTAGTFSNTFFNSTYGGSDYYLTIPPNAYDANYNNGQGKVDALLNLYRPECDLAVMLVNDSAPGGSDGGGKTALVSRGAINSQFYSILAHEAGHVLAGLGDEYTTPNPGYPAIEEPNTTQETNRSLIKWRAWIDPATPVPTPASGFEDVVGLFEGAHYQTTGWYRPRLNCQMGSFGFSIDFCEVCVEAGVLACYRQVRPIESITSANTNLVATNTSPLNFTVSCVQPINHQLVTQWFINGSSQPAATNFTFVLSPALLSNGTHMVTARVSDPTPLVRTDPTNLLQQSVTWQLTVSLPALALSHPRLAGGGRFAFRISGTAPAGFSIHGSTNLSTWTALATNALSGGFFEYTNSVGTNLPWRYFRAVTPPQS
jgi:hypothetical protein